MTASARSLIQAAKQRDWDEVVRLLDEQWSTLISGAPELVRDVVADLPAEVVQANPRWGLAREYLDQLVGGPSAASTRFRGGVPAAAPRGLLDALAQLTSQGAAARGSGRLDDAALAAGRARALLDEASADAVAMLSSALPELQFEWGMVWEYAGDSGRATHEYVESYDAAIRDGNGMAQMKAAGALAWVHAFAGRNLQATRWLERLPESGGAWWEGRSSAPAILARTLLLIDELRFDEARIELNQVPLALAPERWPFQKFLAAILATDHAVALALLSQIDASSAGFPPGVARTGVNAAVAALARSILHERLGNVANAKAALEVSGAGTGTLPAQMLWCARAALAARGGDYFGAGRQVAPIRNLPVSSPRPYIAALALTALSQLRSDNEAGATVTFTQAAALARQHNLFQPFTALNASELAGLIELRPDALPADMHSRVLAHARVDRPDPFSDLSAREHRVLSELFTGKNLSDVATALFVSVNTVKTQLRSIYKKVGVSSRSELEAAAIAHGYTAT